MSEVNCRIGHLDHLETPWGNAGGVVKKPEDVAKMARTGGGPHGGTGGAGLGPAVSSVHRWSP
jgi:hypothetical protein